MQIFKNTYCTNKVDISLFVCCSCFYLTGTNTDGPSNTHPRQCHPSGIQGMTHLALLTWQNTQDCANLSWNKFTTYEKKLFCVPSSWKPPVEKLSIEVEPSWETLTCSKEPLFPIYIFLLSLVKLKIKFEHLMEEVAWSYWLYFFVKIGVAGMK